MNGVQAMRESMAKLVNDLSEILVSECRQSGADLAAFEILSGDLRRAIHAAICRARVRLMEGMEAKEGGEG